MQANTATATIDSEASREIVSERLIAAPRDQVFRAISDGQRLARWWGPKDFRSSFEVFEFRSGGDWKFVMHGPDGKDYPNHSVFTEIDAPARVVLEHRSAPRFIMTITLEEREGQTQLRWRMLFDSAALRDQVARYAVAANQQNFDRLEAELARAQAPATKRQIYVNLPVKDLPRSKAFFGALGFTFNAQFTNEQGACMVIGENIYAMLLVEPFFQTFTKKPVADASKATEVLVCLSCASRAEVDDLVRKALAARGTAPNSPQEHGFMYGHGFTDPDGHVWELIYMDPTAAPPHA